MSFNDFTNINCKNLIYKNKNKQILIMKVKLFKI